MEFLTELWLAVLVSAVCVFVASSVMHMVLPLHRKDYGKLPGESGVLDAMRGQRIAPGQYMFPCADSYKDSCTPEMMEKYKQGPVGFMTVLPSGPPNMVKSLVLWFVYCLIVSFFIAYVARLALEPGAEYMAVFRFTGAVAVLSYAVGNIADSIWKGQRWSTTFKFIFDGVVYGLVTAGAFGWLWPGV